MAFDWLQRPWLNPDMLQNFFNMRYDKKSPVVHSRKDFLFMLVLIFNVNDWFPYFNHQKITKMVNHKFILGEVIYIDILKTFQLACNII